MKSKLDSLPKDLADQIRKVASELSPDSYNCADSFEVEFQNYIVAVNKEYVTFKHLAGPGFEHHEALCEAFVIESSELICQFEGDPVPDRQARFIEQITPRAKELVWNALDMVA